MEHRVNLKHVEILTTTDFVLEMEMGLRPGPGVPIHDSKPACGTLTSTPRVRLGLAWRFASGAFVHEPNPNLVNAGQGSPALRSTS